MKTVKIGMIGGGFVGQLAHLFNYAQISGCEVVALAELKPGLREAVAARYGIPKTYATHSELLRDPEVQAVAVVTERPALGPIALDCLSARKHVITEKPMAGTLEQARKLADQAAKSGVRYAVGYMRRHDAGIQDAKRLLDGLIKSGELGPITYVRAHCYMGESWCGVDGAVSTDEKVQSARETWPIAPDWIPAARRDHYSRFLNVYCHNLNLMRFLLGKEPRVRSAHLSETRGQVVLFDFGDHPAVLEAGGFTNRGWDDTVEIFFADGRLRIENPPAFLRNVPAKVELYRGGAFQQILSPQPTWSWSFRRQAEAFVSDVAADREPLASGRDSLGDLALVDEIWRQELART